VQSESVPDHVKQALGVLNQYRSQLDRIWTSAHRDRDVAQTERELLGPLTALSRDVLLTLYPDCSAALTKP
jgi:hypothetical protein